MLKYQYLLQIVSSSLTGLYYCSIPQSYKAFPEIPLLFNIIHTCTPFHIVEVYVPVVLSLAPQQARPFQSDSLRIVSKKGSLHCQCSVVFKVFLYKGMLLCWFCLFFCKMSFSYLYLFYIFSTFVLHCCTNILMQYAICFLYNLCK